MRESTNGVLAVLMVVTQVLWFALSLVARFLAGLAAAILTAAWKKDDAWPKNLQFHFGGVFGR